MSVKLETLDSDIVRHPEFTLPLEGVTRVHVSKIGGGTVPKLYDGRWAYAIMLRAVGGWCVIASGTDVNTVTPKSHRDVAQMIADEYGDGFDHLTPEQYALTSMTSRTAHIRREGEWLTYCDKQPLANPVVSDVSVPDHVTQCCVPCDNAYRSENFGRCAVGV